ncbi:zinc-type alcohol dehydrogenase [Fusarium pseudoanthophilum]|uniref:Zinc-type alcohol dehydrogenase n=1 Tax=Fusarium pseudoanthophilum TaxID=48495 RepID=A0A8H5P584_9HYPO|nr:zinc-type alcohol dehydrogenase [Fusarium pseudoanthophilum]
MTESRAWVFSERGLPWDVLNLTSQPIPTLPPPLPLPKDVPDPEEWILVKVAFAGLNPGAIFQMTLVPPFIRKPTCVPEMDFSGTVIDVWHPDDESGSAQSKRFNKGDKILAMLPASHTLPTGTGALAEFVRIPAKYAVKKPEGVSRADGAGCLLPGLTARQLVNESGAKTGHRVLVNAASGGIGSMVVQILRKVVGPDGYIVGICSGKNVELVKSLGADEVIDYTQHDHLSKHLAERFSSEPFNTIIDTLGHQALYLASPSYLVPQGNYSSVGIKPPTFFVPDFLRAVLQMKLNEWWPVSPWLGGVGRKWLGTSMMSPTLEDRQAVADMLGRGDLKLVKDSIWPFEETKEAYRKLGGLHARGKILVKYQAFPYYLDLIALNPTPQYSASSLCNSQPFCPTFLISSTPTFRQKLLNSNMTSVLIKPIFIPGNDEYHIRLLSVKLTGSFSNTKYISSLTRPATVLTVLPYKGSVIDCSPSHCPDPKELPGLLLICETLEELQEYHYNSPRRVAMSVTAFLDNGISVEADTYVFPVASFEGEYWDDWELHACASSRRPYPISCPAPGEPISNMPGIPDEDSTDDSVSADLPIKDPKV